MEIKEYHTIEINKIRKDLLAFFEINNEVNYIARLLDENELGEVRPLFNNEFEKMFRSDGPTNMYFLRSLENAWANLTCNYQGVDEENIFTKFYLYVELVDEN